MAECTDTCGQEYCDYVSIIEPMSYGGKYLQDIQSRYEYMTFEYKNFIGSIACTEGYEAAKPDTVVTADQEALWARVWFEVKLV